MNVVKIEDIELDLTKLNRKTCELPEKVLKYLNDYLLPDESIELPLRGRWGMEEAVPQLKISTKRIPNGALYWKISPDFRKYLIMRQALYCGVVWVGLKRCVNEKDNKNKKEVKI